MIRWSILDSLALICLKGFVSTMLDWVEGVRSARMREQMMDLVTFVVFSFCLVLQWPLSLTLALPVMRFVKNIRFSRALSLDFIYGIQILWQKNFLIFTGRNNIAAELNTIQVRFRDFEYVHLTAPTLPVDRSFMPVINPGGNISVSPINLSTKVSSSKSSSSSSSSSLSAILTDYK